MTRHAWRAAHALVASALLLYVPTGSAEPVAASARAPSSLPLESVADLDTVTLQLRQAVWNVRASSEGSLRAPDGSTLAQYIDRWMLPDAIDAELARSSQSAHEAHDRADAAAERASIEEARRILTLQVLRLGTIDGFWKVLARIQSQRSAIEPYVARAPDGERASIEARNATLLTPVQRRIDSLLASDDPGQFDKVLGELFPEVDRILGNYNEERLRLVRLLQDAEPPPVPRLHWTRDSDCPASASGSSGSVDPTFDKASVFQPEYPTDARWAGFEATIVLAAEVSATGCLQSVAIAESSGAPVLDQAALDWAKQLRYLHGEKGGRPVAGSARFAVTFRLTD
jgi:TonB family protein